MGCFFEVSKGHWPHGCFGQASLEDEVDALRRPMMCRAEQIRHRRAKAASISSGPQCLTRPSGLAPRLTSVAPDAEWESSVLVPVPRQASSLSRAPPRPPPAFWSICPKPAERPSMWAPNQVRVARSKVARGLNLVGRDGSHDLPPETSGSGARSIIEIPP
jgi:hypothetical protein